jgi:hypothetical protein
MASATNIKIESFIDNKKQIHSQIFTHFSSNENIKNTKKNIMKTCMNDVLSHLCFSIDSENIILDFRYFKFLSSSENYDLMISYIVSIIQNVLKNKETIIFHVNMDTITLLHVEKHFGFIKNFSQILNNKFPDRLDICYIYNASFVFSKILGIVSVFIDKTTQQKIKLVKEI